MRRLSEDADKRCYFQMVASLDQQKAMFWDALYEFGGDRTIALISKLNVIEDLLVSSELDEAEAAMLLTAETFMLKQSVLKCIEVRDGLSDP